MKHLIGLLFCFGILLLAGTTGTHAQAVPAFETSYQTACPDTGMPVSLNRFTESFIKADHAFGTQVQKAFTVDIQKLRIASGQAAAQAYLALIYKYKPVPDCSVQYIYKGRYRYYMCYLYQYPQKYNQPPNYYNL